LRFSRKIPVLLSCCILKKKDTRGNSAVSADAYPLGF
jgi:hypothetical protein